MGQIIAVVLAGLAVIVQLYAGFVRWNLFKDVFPLRLKRRKPKQLRQTKRLRQMTVTELAEMIEDNNRKAFWQNIGLTFTSILLGYLLAKFF